MSLLKPPAKVSLPEDAAERVKVTREGADIMNRLKEPKLVMGWQSMDTAPKDGRCVLLHHPHIDDAVACFWQDDTWIVRWDHSEFSSPELWCPIPPLAGRIW